MHKHARLTACGREILVRRVLAEGYTVSEASEAFGISSKTVRKWVRRFREEGLAGLHDRSSRPHRSPRAIDVGLRERIVRLRREWQTGMGIAERVGVCRATVSRVLRRARLSRWRDLDPPPPVQRYEHAAPGDMLHLDTKKLGRVRGIGHRITGDPRDRSRGAGWEFAHVCVDDHSRVAEIAVADDERHATATDFLQQVVQRYAALGITVKRVMTDNGACYRSTQFRDACRDLGLRHIFTRPYSPQTNGKAERFIQSLLRESIYARAYRSSAERTRALYRWIHRYNWHRPHTSLGGKPPISRILLTGNNLLRLHS
jgi:transposase InsO family protein